ncbi:Rpn family recombination-promoting nuclease/putative transposase [Clostridium gasigenes]|uniref:Rpn family recombination-promoting nuclease/putative transposase n=1 Tax=Clostridium gasigenes TaxID=94869 RepID=UPI001C0CF7BB|nr:Rpn family recombination-promoting nuclease/putative transposase [Clostridium gasigenes]
MKKDINNIHDKGYKDMYTNQEVFVNVVKDTLNYPWAIDIKPSDLILVDKSYIQPNYHDKESDIVYRAKVGDEEVIFFVLLEFQSRIDYSMPIRLFFYISEILRREIKPEKIKSKSKNIKIPAVVPIVLYNGQKTWDAEVSFRNIVSEEQLFSNSIIDFTYNIVDVNNYSKDTLLNLKSVTGAIFLLDQKINEEEFLERIKLIALTFDKMSESERNILLHWITQTTEEPIAKSSKEILLADKKEVIKVVANNSNIIKEMEEKAELRGEEKGEKKGMAKSLISLLNIKFLQLPKEYEEKIMELNEEKIEEVTRNIFNINSLSDVDKFFSVK